MSHKPETAGLDDASILAAEESLIEYPCDFPIKVVGINHENLRAELTAIVQHHDPEFNPETLELRPSSGRKYLGLTFIVRATSREQLDALYRELHAHSWVKYVL